MAITLKQQIDHVKAAASPQDLWALTCAFFYARNAKMIAYRHFIGRPDPNEELMVIAEGYPEDFLEDVFKHNYMRVNPLPDLATRCADPFFWSDVPAMTELLEAEEHFVTEAMLRLGEGLAIQVFGPMSRNGLFNVGFGTTRPTFSARDMKEMQLACQLSHLAYVKMTPDYVHGSTQMTAREREVLEWIAKGKSNSVIADILGISVHTVDTHVRRIFRKLDVNDRTTAAVKGLGAGLVQAAA